MAQVELKKLDSGELFPTMKLNLVDGTTLEMPEMMKNKWCVLLIYRGRW